MDVSDELHTLTTLPLRKELLTLDMRLDDLQSIWTVEERKIFCLGWELDPSSLAI